MHKDLVNKVGADLFSIPALSSRIVRSKFTKVTLANIEVSLTPLHFEILMLLAEEGSLPVFEIGKRLVLAKAHMTQLVDKLVEKEMVIREADSSDRRVTRISLTDTGKQSLDNLNRIIGEALEKALSSLSDHDLKDLSISLEKIRNILPKMIQA
ncbi:MAG: MarR family transcriptional regulator [Deltaproteobacteria bacterium]|nr:MarR family transcriptional regulator [Deltaproteobacteria bacterium]